MWPYYAILLTVIFLQYIPKLKVSKINICYESGILLLFFFAAFRGNGSGDYFTYLSRGENIYTLSDVVNNNTSMEIGYCFLYWIINKIHLPSQFIIIFMNTISIICVRNFINIYSNNKLLSLLLFMPLYFQFDMHAARTAVAIGISLISIKYVINRNLIKFIICVIAAATFHNTAFVTIALYILPYLKIYSGLGMSIVLCGIFLKSFISVDMIIYKLLCTFRLNLFAIKYIGYVNSETFGYPFKLYDPRLLLLIGIYFVAIIIMKTKNVIENYIVNCCFVNILVLIIFSEHTFIAYRLASFFNVYTLILIPQILSRLNLKNNSEHYRTSYVGDYNFNIMSVVMIVGVYALYTIGIFYDGVPYKVFLFNN